MALFAVLALISIVAPTSLCADGERTIWLYNIHTKESLKIAFKRNGRFIPKALEKINWYLRDWRRNEPTKMDPELIDLVWEIHAELGSRMPVHVISGYRSPATNNMLRRTRGGQAKRSQHLLGKAMDVQFPDIPVRRLRYSALLREQGGVGYYPTSATPFVHIDTGRVRHWPRMGREELALLFPSGRTKHRPSRGGPITRQDAVIARRNNPALAQRVAAFHVRRRNGPSVAENNARLASAAPISPPAPRLVERAGPARVRPPQRKPVRNAADAGGWSATLKRARIPVPKPAPASQRPTRIAGPAVAGKAGRTIAGGPAPMPFRPAIAAISASDRSRLASLASSLLARAVPPPPPTRHNAGAELGSQQEQWISAPAYDEEHPEELFYRPFPIAPYITQTASADDPALQHMTHPDIDRTIALLVEDGTDDPPLQMRPGLQLAGLMWAQAFNNGMTPEQSEVARDSNRAKPKLGRRLVRLAGR